MTDRGRKVLDDRRTSLIIDPADGRVPPLTPEAQARAASAARRSRRRRGRTGEPQHGRAVHHLWISVGHPAHAVQQQHPDPAGAWIRGHHPRDDSRDADHSARRPSGRRPEDSAVVRRLARPLGRRHAGRRVAELFRQDQLPRLRQDAAHDRALHARRQGSGRLPAHHRRSPHLRASVDDRASDEDRAKGRSTSTPATKPTSACTTFSRWRATKRRRRPRRSEDVGSAIANRCRGKRTAMRAKLTVAVACMGLLLAVRPLVAHHSFAAEFDAENPVQLRGVVTGMDWVNPHSWIHLDVKNEDGTVTKWMVEGATPNTLAPARLHEELAAGRHRDRRLWLPREERRQPRERPRCDAAGRQAAVPRIVGNRCAGGRKRAPGEVDSMKSTRSCAQTRGASARWRSSARSPGRSSRASAPAPRSNRSQSPEAQAAQQQLQKRFAYPVVRDQRGAIPPGPRPLARAAARRRSVGVADDGAARHQGVHRDAGACRIRGVWRSCRTAAC